MKEHVAYIGFEKLPSKEDIVRALVEDPPDVRWRVVRALFRLADPKEREELIRDLRPHLLAVEDFRIRFRINLALQALHRPVSPGNFTLERGRGVRLSRENGASFGTTATSAADRGFFGVVDFHIHPKSPDMKFMADLREAGIVRAVILATDTDPEDADRPEVREKLEEAYSLSALSHRAPFEKMLGHIRSSLYSPSHVTNIDVADWVADYPDLLVGFGSVNLSRDRAYVEDKLDEIERLNLRGVKLLPQSQFFNPAENENTVILFEYCRRTDSIILTHTGCGPGPFEIPELSRNAHPGLWETLVKKYPDVPLVLAHCGSYSSEIPGIWLREALELGMNYRNVYVDVAAVDWLLNREMVIKEIRKTIGFDRVLFGTDYPLPLTAGVSLAYLVSAIKVNTFLTEKEKQKVLGGNAKRLLDAKNGSGR